ncbi:Shikimate dehydrogenase (NADP(+)) [Nymphon striatum]|nr:Shikimate dehydrogenase (NADP(+)) [Nymphon striatum]
MPGVNFSTQTADIDEREVEAPLIQAGLGGEDVAEVLAIAKATEVSKTNVDAYVIGCDQTLSLEGELLHKPLGIEPENFQKFLKDLPNSEFAGGNVTIPHKEIAFENLTKFDDAAKAIGAVNTLWLESEILCGGNTDAYGFSANLDEFAPEWRDGKTAIVLGAGGASRAIVYSLLEGVLKIFTS